LTCDQLRKADSRACRRSRLPERADAPYRLGHRHAGVAEALSQHLDAHLIVQRYSRLVIDCNRPAPCRRLDPAHHEATTISATRAFHARQPRCGARRSSIPTHRRIDEIIDQRGSAGMPTVLVSLHSFTPVYAGIARPWHIGTLYHQDTHLPPLLLKLLRAEGRPGGRDNEPMRSATRPTTRSVHGEARGLMNTGIEIRQD